MIHCNRRLALWWLGGGAVSSRSRWATNCSRVPRIIVWQVWLGIVLAISREPQVTVSLINPIDRMLNAEPGRKDLPESFRGGTKLIIDFYVYRVDSCIIVIFISRFDSKWQNCRTGATTKKHSMCVLSFRRFAPVQIEWESGALLEQCHVIRKGPSCSGGPLFCQR